MYDEFVHVYVPVCMFVYSLSAHVPPTRLRVAVELTVPSFFCFRKTVRSLSRPPPLMIVLLVSIVCLLTYLQYLLYLEYLQYLQYLWPDDRQRDHSRHTHDNTCCDPSDPAVGRSPTELTNCESYYCTAVPQWPIAVLVSRREGV